MILLIDNYDSFTFNLYQMLAAVYPDVYVVRNDKISLSDIEELQPKAIVLSPGPGRPEEAGICLGLIRKFAPSIPILGVCLGHQAIAEVFGSEVVQAENILHGKSSVVFHSRKNLFKKMPLPFTAGRYHSLIVKRETLSEELSIEAETSSGEIMAIKHKKYPCYGVQFHPESILTPQGSILIQNFLESEVLALC